MSSRRDLWTRPVSEIPSFCSLAPHTRNARLMVATVFRTCSTRPQKASVELRSPSARDTRSNGSRCRYVDNDISTWCGRARSLFSKNDHTERRLSNLPCAVCETFVCFYNRQRRRRTLVSRHKLDDTPIVGILLWFS